MSEKKDKSHLQLLTPEFRVSHPHVFKPTQLSKNGKATGELRYSIEMLFDKTKVTLAELQKPVLNAIIDQWGPKSQGKWPAGLKTPIRDGDKPHGKKKEIKPEHVGMWVVKAGSRADFGKPYVVGKNPKESISIEGDFYPGCYARAAVFAKVYEAADNDGVTFILDGVQKIRDGEPLGSKRSADQMFGVIADDDMNFDEGSFDEDDNELGV